MPLDNDVLARLRAPATAREWADWWLLHQPTYRELAQWPLDRLRGEMALRWRHVEAAADRLAQVQRDKPAYARHLVTRTEQDARRALDRQVTVWRLAAWLWHYKRSRRPIPHALPPGVGVICFPPRRVRRDYAAEREEREGERWLVRTHGIGSLAPLYKVLAFDPDRPDILTPLPDVPF